MQRPDRCGALTEFLTTMVSSLADIQLQAVDDLLVELGSPEPEPGPELAATRVTRSSAVTPPASPANIPPPSPANKAAAADGGGSARV